MREMFQNIRFLTGRDFRKLMWSGVFSALDSFFNAGMYGVMLLVLLDLGRDTFTLSRLGTDIILLLGLFALRCAAQGIALTKVQYDGPVISKKLRLQLGNHIRNLNLGFFNQTSQGKLNAILTTDINDTETILTHCICDLAKITAFTVFGLSASII